ncbi:MAG: hypothetical protein IJ867_07380 [Clostridia bacterium]|nr:hypothetical protein [Clostridia bacterium]
MKNRNKGAISIFALLSMMFFLIFIMVAYNNVMQKGKTQVETEGVLVDYYKSSQTAAEMITAANGGDIQKSATNKDTKLRQTAQQNQATNGTVNTYVYSNGKYYKITN